MEEDLKVYSRITETKEDGKITKVVIVRHAESIANTEGKYQGQTYDTDLSELGKKQAQALANRLKNYGVKKIITSPLKRTHQTAKHVADLIGCGIEIDRQIIETNHGLWEGIHKDTIKTDYPELFDMWHSNPRDIIFPQGESFFQTIERTLLFLEKTEFQSDTLVVTHDNILRAMISLINGSDVNSMWEIPLETAAINIFEVNRVNGKNLFHILKLNDVDHLSGIRNNVSKHAL